MEERIFKRAEAIRILIEIDQDHIDEGEVDANDIHSMSNAELEAELCLSGYIHDMDMGGVID